MGFSRIPKAPQSQTPPLDLSEKFSWQLSPVFPACKLLKLKDSDVTTITIHLKTVANKLIG